MSNGSTGLIIITVRSDKYISTYSFEDILGSSLIFNNKHTGTCFENATDIFIQKKMFAFHYYEMNDFDYEGVVKANTLSLRMK